ncbi:DNA uptake protein ComE-like DNA-binding protein [Chryseobacterium sp. SORGH_AS 447]|uniref:helix-hairpin-helix domain-containing protein n=1 Tax=Chryseobacterium sp. SORGH_AS_0447 TaxID=3041769 RepID=UPI00278A084D|nr:helix-hairpin-helix domain-containing protein [Chryseobacterium sp. SORGH_AS_0447]MDQ1162837.1 DNA uptake protein ComE-like DNA-binding protein [Chryseobacterium sp. SORGH_AS_0447]
MMKKSYYQKLAGMGILLAILFTFQEYTSKEKEDFSDVKFITKSAVPLHLTEFDPNDLDQKQWQHLGFTEKQVATILNYKKVVGGKFVSKEQLKKCFAISEDRFSTIKNYILLPETSREAKSGNFNQIEKKAITISGSFNPDAYTAEDWQKMGFSEKQAQAILKYKSYLGGSFTSKEKFRECFIISEENFKKISPYLLLPEKTPANFNQYAKNTKPEKSRIKYYAFDPNTMDLEGWKSLGFSDRQAQTIINYRDRNLKGSFKSLEEIQRCFVISPEKFVEMKPFIRLNTTFAKTSNQNQELNQQEKTDFSNVDLNSITFRQLIEFGFDERAAGSMIGFRKKLGGFVNKEQILTTYNIDKELTQKLLSTAPLNTSNVQKYTLLDAPEEWLKSHPYFKYSADKIIFYRLSEKDERKIWKLLKVKPEYEARMRWYLK